MLGNFLCCYMLLSSDFFQNELFQKILSDRNTYRVSNNLDPDRDRHSVSPDLGPKCLQRLSAEDQVAASKERVNILFVFSSKLCYGCV